MKITMTKQELLALVEVAKRGYIASNSVYEALTNKSTRTNLNSKEMLSSLLIEAHGLVLEASELSSKGWSLSYEEAHNIIEKIASLKERVEYHNDLYGDNNTLECLVRMLSKSSDIMTQRINDMIDDELYGDKSYLDVFGTEEDIKMQQQREAVYKK